MSEEIKETVVAQEATETKEVKKGRPQRILSRFLY